VSPILSSPIMFPFLVFLCLQHVQSWNSLPDNLIKTPYGYQVLAKHTATISNVRCDTPWKCKASVITNTIAECTICDDDLGIPASPYYGADKDMEVSPYDQVHLKTFEAIEEPKTGEGDDSEKEESKSLMPMTTDQAAAAKEKQRELDKLDPNYNCPPRSEDEFVLPCCSPMRDLVTGEFSVKYAADSSSPFLLEINSRRHQRTNRLRSKQKSSTAKNKGFMDTLKSAAGAVGSLLPCCGSGSSCCRWCKDACDELEQINMPRLWWSLCNGADRENTEKTMMYRNIDTMMHPFKSTVGGAGGAGAASALSAFRV
jgi:hypothetical protein